MEPSAVVLFAREMVEKMAIRTLIIGLLFALLCSNSRVHAQQPLIDEIVRKAEAREPEDGFCSRTRWPLYTYEGFLSHLKAARVGTWKVNKYENGACQLDRATAVRQQDGRKCVEYSYWTCSRQRNRCGATSSVDCIAPDGKSFQRQ